MKIFELIKKVNDGEIISDIDLQREIVYNEEKQSLVIDSILNDVPLPAFYFWTNSENKSEVLDGKQRIEAISKFMHNLIQYQGRTWKELSKEEQEKINKTELNTIFSSGSETLKRKIFNRINTLGVPLSKFEVLNGLYSGEYLRSLTIYTREDKNVQKILDSNSRGKNELYILNLIIKLKYKSNQTINEYLEKNKNNSFEIDVVFIKKIFAFVSSIFKKYLNKDILFYLANKYEKDITIWKSRSNEINNWLEEWKKTDDYKLTIKKQNVIEEGIIAIVEGVSVDAQRNFTKEQKETFVKHLIQKKSDLLVEDDKIKCVLCKKIIMISEGQMDHIEPWSKGGLTSLANAQLLCAPCNLNKGNKTI